jgi:hypothetical protein
LKLLEIKGIYTTQLLKLTMMQLNTLHTPFSYQAVIKDWNPCQGGTRVVEEM